MKKIIILGAGTYQVDLIKKAKEMGLYTVVFSPGDYPGMKYADKLVDVNIMDKDAVLEAARAEKPDGIISDQTDMAVESIAYACEKLDLPGNGTEVVKFFIDKHLMRKKCEELGLPSIRSEVTSDIDEARLLFREIGNPVIIKPVDSGGSRGVTKINSEEELCRYFSEAAGYSSNGNVIIEKFIEGTEFEVDSIAVNGQIKPLMHADLQEFKIPNIFSSMTRLYPSTFDSETIDRLLAYDANVLKGFGLKQGLTHSEYIMEDKTGEIYLIETAVRGGGTFISSHIAELQTGLNTAEFLLNMALGNLSSLPKFEHEKCHCGYVAFYLPPGRIVSIEGVEDVMNLDYVHKTTLEGIQIGDETKEFHDKRNRHAVILSGASRKELLKRIKEVKSILKIKVNADGSIRDPIWE